MTVQPAPPLPERDDKRPPAWLPRALVMIVIAAFVGMWIWRALGALTTTIVIIVLAWFIALAMEPSIRWLVRHGWRRTRATGLVMVTFLVGSAVVLALFGQLFIEQLVALISSLPEYYADLASWLHNEFDIDIPTSDEAVSTITAHWRDIAPGVLGAGASIVSGLFMASSILLVVYYMASRGPAFRASVLRMFATNHQVEVLRVWEVSQQKIANFITSRLVLAGLSATFTTVFLLIVDVPYALPLGVFTGIVSQFIPTIGTYIGGALPVAVALTISPAKGLLVLAFIIAYQQVENLIFSPKISADSLDLNPAVSFLGVIGFGAMFGAIGAFLALPVVATVQAIASTYVGRHELVDSPLLTEDVAALKKNHGWKQVHEDAVTGAGASDEGPDASSSADDRPPAQP